MKIVPTIAVALSLFVCGAAPSFASKHKPVAMSHAVAMSKLAPADEYFGPLKMSILGIGNALNNVKRRINGGDMSDDTLASLNQVRGSIQDWERRYPRDPWLSRTLLALHATYMLFPDDRARSHAAATASWLVAKYPSSKEASFVRNVRTTTASRESLKTAER